METLHNLPNDQNSGSLILMPYGCGEQNMLNFAPNIFILQYLKASRQDTPEATKKLIEHMKTGYQREVLYRLDDGSFIAFGKADDSGSTWLIAFVLKSFAQAKPYVTIDESSLETARSWLQDNQTSSGCFQSVGKVFHKGMKDTVVALQAMASYESHLYQGDLNMVIKVKVSGLDHSFSLDEFNKLLTQRVTLPVLPTTVSLNTVGQGCAVFQSVLQYNIPDPEASDAFSSTVKTKTEQDKLCVTKRITACAAYQLPDGKTNMAAIEINLVSGYIPEKIEKNINVIKRYEVDGSKVSFCIEEFTAENVCVSFHVIREVDIEYAKPGTVVLYDYYQPEFSVSEKYWLPPPDDCIYE